MTAQAKDTTAAFDNWTKGSYAQLFQIFDDEVEMFGKIPTPCPTNFKFYQRSVHQVDKKAVPALTVPWIKMIVNVYRDYMLGDGEWFEKHLEKKKPPAPEPAPVSAPCAAPQVDSAPEHKHEPIVDADLIADIVSEKLEEPIKNLGQSISVVLKQMQRENLKQLDDTQTANRKALDTKFNSLEHSILSSLQDRIQTEIHGAVVASLESITGVIVDSVVSKLPDHITSKLNALVDERIDKIFGEDNSAPKKVEEPEEKLVDLTVLLESGKSFKPKPVQTKKSDEPLGSTDRPLKILVLDLNRDQMSQVRANINERWAIIDQGKGSSLNDLLVAKYDFVLGTLYTSKEEGKSAAMSWPDKYQLIGGGYFNVRSAIKRVVNEWRQDVVLG